MQPDMFLRLSKLLYTSITGPAGPTLIAFPISGGLFLFVGFGLGHVFDLKSNIFGISHLYLNDCFRPKAAGQQKSIYGVLHPKLVVNTCILCAYKQG
jgi:hypothetical protein